MKKVAVLLLCCILAHSVCSIEAVDDSPKPTTSPPTTSTIVPPTTKPSTTSTTSPTTPPTTAAPTSTTKAPPVPEPGTGKWIVSGENSTCIIAQMMIELTVKMNTGNTTNSKTISVPANGATATGSCDKEETLNLSWKSPGELNNTIFFKFTKYMKTYVLHDLTVQIAAAEVQDKRNGSFKFNYEQPHFNTTVGNSYRCLRLQTFDLKNDTTNATAAQMKVSHLHLQAFREEKTDVFALAEDCAFDTSDVVPIAVGCALAVLVVIVLGAYVINRRCQPRGYLSM